MDIYDVQYNILLQSDFVNLPNLCMYNKTASMICYNTQFWLDYYKYHNMPLPKENFKHPNQWIKNIGQIYMQKCLDMMKSSGYSNKHQCYNMCKKCYSKNIIITKMQARHIDENETIKIKCQDCHHTYINY
jgi:hypothetical protein